jgi:hypothetical protein
MTKRERNSSTDSSDRVGRCAMSTDFFLSGSDRYLKDPNICVGGDEGSVVRGRSPLCGYFFE